MSDLIDRQAAIDAMNKRARDTFTLASGYKYYLGALHDIADDIKKLPSAQPERKKGEWIPKDDGRYHCSSCDGIAPKGYRWDFCPICGADMRGGKGGKK